MYSHRGALPSDGSYERDPELIRTDQDEHEGARQKDQCQHDLGSRLTHEMSMSPSSTTFPSASRISMWLEPTKPSG